MAGIDTSLRERLRARVGPERLAWLDRTVAGVADGSIEIAHVFPAVAREVGREGLDAGGATIHLASGDRVALAAWRIDDAARVLLVRAAGARGGAGVAIARELYERGDARERTGALRALSLLPGAEADAGALPAVLDAMRHNQGEIFEAAIADNAYAAWHLPQHEWRKAVLKAAFIGVAVDRVLRLAQRTDPELAGSLFEYVAEREAAGRGVAPALWQVIAAHPPRGLAGKLVGYLEHPAPEHRAAAALALGMLLRAGDARPRPFLVDRGERETDDVVKVAIRSAIAGG